MKGILNKISECEKIILRQSKLRTGDMTEQLTIGTHKLTIIQKRLTVNGAVFIIPGLTIQPIVIVFHQNQ